MPLGSEYFLDVHPGIIQRELSLGALGSACGAGAIDGELGKIQHSIMDGSTHVPALFEHQCQHGIFHNSS